VAPDNILLTSTKELFIKAGLVVKSEGVNITESSPLFTPACDNLRLRIFNIVPIAGKI